MKTILATALLALTLATSSASAGLVNDHTIKAQDTQTRIDVARGVQAGY